MNGIEGEILPSLEQTLKQPRNIRLRCQRCGAKIGPNHYFDQQTVDILGVAEDEEVESVGEVSIALWRCTCGQWIARQT